MPDRAGKGPAAPPSPSWSHSQHGSEQDSRCPSGTDATGSARSPGMYTGGHGSHTSSSSPSDQRSSKVAGPSGRSGSPSGSRCSRLSRSPLPRWPSCERNGHPVQGPRPENRARASHAMAPNQPPFPAPGPGSWVFYPDTGARCPETRTSTGGLTPPANRRPRPAVSRTRHHRSRSLTRDRCPRHRRPQ